MNDLRQIVTCSRFDNGVRDHSLALRAGRDKKHSLALRGGGARGAILLEVIVSMGLLIFGMAVVGLQVNAGLDAARSSDIGTRAVMLADSKLAELKAGILQPETHDDELKGDFGAMYPGYSWRITIEKTDLDVFNMITLEIGFNRKEMEAQIANPDRELNFEDEGTRTIHTAHRLVPIPADVNLERDFGLSQDELARLQNPGGGGGQNEGGGSRGGEGGGGGLDGLNDLLANLGSLSDLQSFDPRMLSALPPEEFAKIAALLEAFLGRGSSTHATPEEMLDSLLNDSGNNRRGGGGNQNNSNNNAGGGAGGGQQGGGDGGSNTGNDRPGGNRSGRNRSGDDSRSGSDVSDGSDSSNDSGGGGEGRRGNRRGRNRDRDGNNSSDSGNDGGDAGSDRDGNNNSGGGRAGNRRGRDRGSDSGTNDSGGGGQNRTRRQREDDGSRASGNDARQRDDRDQHSQDNNSNDNDDEQDSTPRRRTRQR